MSTAQLQSQSARPTHNQPEHVNKSHYLPLELIDKCMNQPIWILCKNHTEYSGILKGYDDYVNVVLENVTEIQYGQNKSSQVLQSILLNGSSIAAICPNTTAK